MATLLLHLSEQSIFEIDGLDELIDGLDTVIAKNLSSIQKNSFKSEIFYNYIIQRSRVLNLPLSHFGNVKKSFVKSKISIVSSRLFGWASNPGLQKYNDTKLCDQVITFLSRGNSSNIEQLSVISNIDELILFYITSYRISSSALSSAVSMNILLLGLIKIANNLSVHDKEFFNVMIMTLIKEESMMYGLQLEVENV